MERHAGDNCKRQGYQGRPAPTRPRRATTDQARQQREEWNELDPADSVTEASKAEPAQTTRVTRDGRRLKRVRCGECWWVTRDEEAGVRAYTKNGVTTKFWHGYYSGKAVCHLTGGAIPTVDAANKQEYDIFLDLFDRVCSLVGEAPQTVVGDRGYGVEKCYQRATSRGTAPVFPWRGPHASVNKLTHDRHGVKRCKHCGGEMKQKRFAIQKRRPCLWFQCTAPRTPDCGGEQRIYCDADWRYLVPLSRLEPLYHELMATHSSYEGVHDYWRDRYRVAADSLGARPKVVSLAWHRLRANVACLIDWLRIATVNNWLGSARGVKRKGTRSQEQRGRDRLAKLLTDRVAAKLDLPYGPEAKALGLGKAKPPAPPPKP